MSDSFSWQICSFIKSLEITGITSFIVATILDKTETDINTELIVVVVVDLKTDILVCRDINFPVLCALLYLHHM